jgi:hypothetical protein
MNIQLNRIDLAKLAPELRRLENQWIAISEINTIVAHGPTYHEALKKVKNPQEVILFKVPPLEYSLAPLNSRRKWVSPSIWPGKKDCALR